MGGGLGRGAIMSSLAGFEAAPLPARSSRGEGGDLAVGCCVKLSPVIAIWFAKDGVSDYFQIESQWKT